MHIHTQINVNLFCCQPTIVSLFRICLKKSNSAERSSANSLLKDAVSLRIRDETAKLCFFKELQHKHKNINHKYNTQKQFTFSYYCKEVKGCYDNYFQVMADKQ